MKILKMVYTLLFSLQNAVCFIILTYLVSVLFTFYIQGVLKLKKIIPAPKVNSPRWTKLLWVIFWNWIHAFKKIQTFEISRFWNRVVEIFSLLGRYVAWVGGWLPTDGLSWNVGKQKSIYASQNPRKAKNKNTAILYYIQISFHMKKISLYS